MPDYERLLGAGKSASTLLVLFIPSRDLYLEEKDAVSENGEED